MRTTIWNGKEVVLGEDATPTWEQLLPAMVGALTEIPLDGTAEQREARDSIWNELRRMARIADKAMRMQKAEETSKIHWGSRSSKKDVCPSCDHVGLAMASGNVRSCPNCYNDYHKPKRGEA